MGLCIGIRQEQLRDAVEYIDLDKYKFKFLYDTDEHDDYHEDLGIKSLNDIIVFSGCASYFRSMRHKTTGEETHETWDRMVRKIFEDERHLAIVNDFYDNPYMVLVFPETYVDESAQRGNLNITYNADVREKLMEIFLHYLDFQEGMPCITLDAYKTGVVKDMDEGNIQFKLRQERIKENNRNKYKEQLVRHFEEAFKFRLITYYTKLREFSLDDIMRKLGDLGYLDERFNSGDLYIYEEEARRLLARRLCAISYKNDIEILMEQKLIDPSRITYNLNVR